MHADKVNENLLYRGATHHQPLNFPRTYAISRNPPFFLDACCVATELYMNRFRMKGGAFGFITWMLVLHSWVKVVSLLGGASAFLHRGYRYGQPASRTPGKQVRAVRAYRQSGFSV